MTVGRHRRQTEKIERFMTTPAGSPPSGGCSRLRQALKGTAGFPEKSPLRQEAMRAAAWRRAHRGHRRRVFPQSVVDGGGTGSPVVKSMIDVERYPLAGGLRAEHADALSLP